MSWNKNTVSESEIPAVIKTLKDLGVSYRLEVLGEVIGLGLNDYDDDSKYKIKRLEYKDTVILEQMERHPDCDCNDVITSRKFKKDEEPKKWEVEIHLVEQGY